MHRFQLQLNLYEYISGSTYSLILLTDNLVVKGDDSEYIETSKTCHKMAKDDNNLIRHENVNTSRKLSNKQQEPIV